MAILSKQMYRQIIKKTIILFLILLFLGCDNSDNIDYQKSIDSADLQSYNSYLIKHPNGSHIAKIKRLKERYYYKEAKRQNLLPYFDEYLEKYPTGRYIKEIKKLREKYFFKIAQDENSIREYEYFLETFPNGFLAEEAKSVLEKLRFDEASAIDSIEIYTRFMQDFPNSQKNPIIQSRLSLLKERNNLEHITSNTQDQNSLIILQKMYESEHNTTKKQTLNKKIKQSLTTIELILKNDKIEISNVVNNQDISKKFRLAVNTSLFLYMSGEKIDNQGLNTAISGNKWLDYGLLINIDTNQAVKDLESGVPIGGELTNMLDAKYIDIHSGFYNLKFHSDISRAWNDFNGNPPTNNHWGISLYFISFAKDILPQLNTLIQDYPHSTHYKTYAKLRELALTKAKTLIDDKFRFKKELGETWSQFEFQDDIFKIESFLKKYPNNIFTPIIKYALLNKRLLRMYRDIKISKVETTEKAVNPQQTHWFTRALENEGIVATYEDGENAAEDINSGNGAYFSRVKAKQYYFTGFIENSSTDITYDLDIRCDFHIQGMTEGGIWLFRTSHKTNKIKSLHYKISNLKPGKRRAFVFKIKANSGEAINLGLLGASSSSYIVQWQVNVNELLNSNIPASLIASQNKLLNESGLDQIDFENQNVIPAQASPQIVDIQEEDLEISF